MNYIMGFFPFFLGLIMAYFLGWSLKELVWSLWFSSLIVGMSYIFWAAFKKACPSKGCRLKIIPAVITVLFFTIHFGLFHAGHAFFIYQFLPVSFSDFKMYIWVLPLAFWANHSLFWQKDNFNPTLIYGSVVKLHLVIFVLAGLALSQFNNFGIYALVYAWFFFPFETVYRSIIKSTPVVLKEK